MKFDRVTSPIDGDYEIEMADEAPPRRHRAIILGCLAAVYLAMTGIIIYLLASKYPASSMPVILMVGDSITEYAANVHMHGFQASLAHDYIRHADVVNRGRAGWSTANWRPKIPALIREWEARPPILVTIALGTNDASLPNATGLYVPPEKYTANLEAMVVRLSDAFPATQFLFVTPAVSDDDSAMGQLHRNDRAGTYAALCKQVGDKWKIPVVDLWTPLQGKQKTVLSDGLHLNQAGNEFVYDQIKNAIATSYPQLRPSALPERS
ncbi:hypothetical protein SPRG_14855 [Saprolegnia parasitica CBS 223.65]|uniref:SGNH hydrolase-type esterase domain-containing protein n=1 Tax=Saprolegnia parasitica (strain CBS 223.65) TaxID=695850 RepID=A0A067BLC7_SAPPC|nr:hypothetical protein SPRG_14855 [Saprolegnia parasitica CBS 223.65]KDO19018.1 hypothetical protein SPRG_14855 [Saprolegnia parasitica CBS 223.65]|eukprot:XP_012210273.1 hypothetical protein SPRG_14855 [Saprolegnia parasitica CBS 223.65]